MGGLADLSKNYGRFVSLPCHFLKDLKNGSKNCNGDDDYVPKSHGKTLGGLRLRLHRLRCENPQLLLKIATE